MTAHLEPTMLETCKKVKVQSGTSIVTVKPFLMLKLVKMILRSRMKKKKKKNVNTGEV
jgi:hypothetical protein